MKNPVRETTFRFNCSTDIFPLDELHSLAENGERLEGLATGAIAPESAEDERFLKVDREEAEPQSLAERAWLRLKYRREFEAEEAAKTVPEKEDYGIIEWDKEKCWW